MRRCHLRGGRLLHLGEGAAVAKERGAVQGRDQLRVHVAQHIRAGRGRDEHEHGRVTALVVGIGRMDLAVRAVVVVVVVAPRAGRAA